jgi:hypothetical protein
MLELGVFMKGFNYGRLLWLQGPAGTRKVRITYELLNFCLVKESQVLQMTAHQFVDMLQVGSARLYSETYEVLIVRGFENLPRKKLNSFVESMKDYQAFKALLQMRVILISSEHTEKMERSLKRLNPVIIRIRGIGDDPEELNERIHATLEAASQLTQKKVTRITEEVATFLEGFPFRKNDEDLLAILVAALRNLVGTILRMEDFLKIDPQKPLSEPHSGIHKYW